MQNYEQWIEQFIHSYIFKMYELKYELVQMESELSQHNHKHKQLKATQWTVQSRMEVLSNTCHNCIEREIIRTVWTSVFQMKWAVLLFENVKTLDSVTDRKELQLFRN